MQSVTYLYILALISQSEAGNFLWMTCTSLINNFKCTWNMSAACKLSKFYSVSNLTFDFSLPALASSVIIVIIGRYGEWKQTGEKNLDTVIALW